MKTENKDARNIYKDEYVVDFSKPSDPDKVIGKAAWIAKLKELVASLPEGPVLENAKAELAKLEGGK